MAKSIGIDLGTTNSVACIKKVHTEILKNSEGDLITPSCVTIDNKKGLLKFLGKQKFIVGKHALEWMKQDPENTITAVKRLMGRSLQTPEVQKLISDRQQQYKITTHSRGTENSLAIVLKNNEYTPEQISSKILEKIHKDAEKNVKDKIEYAVITVPAYFNDKQKHATRTAAALAGLKVRRLLPEPTAAALSFGVDTVNEDEAKTVLVFDFGGGTFDLSVLTISGGQFIEQGKGGNMWLGGEDIDRKIADYVLQETASEYEIENIAEFIDNQASETKNLFYGELKAAVEKAKILLSDENSAYIEILGMLKDSDGDLIDVDVELTRDQFENIISPMVESAMELTRNLLNDIHFTHDLIDNILLVGGSSRIPCIIKALEKEFGSKKVFLHERPMLAIAEGSAILSHRLSDTYECPECGHIVAQTDTTCSRCEFDLEKYVIDQGVFDIVHAAAHDYYIYLENGEKHLLVEKNTPLPHEKTELFKLVHHEQQLIHMQFFNIVNEQEESIGDLWLGFDNNNEDENEDEDVQPPSLEVTLKIDENNLVEVSASLKELPDVEISKTLSRGKADEKLFISLKNMINQANQKGYNQFTIIDMTSKTVGIIKDINKVLAKETGEVIEPVYNLAEMKIETARQMADDGNDSKPLIYYTKSVLASFGKALSPKEQKNIQKKIDTLEEMTEHGTYEENLKAYNDLNKALDKHYLINMLMNLQNAGDICKSHEPAKSTKFFTAITNIMDALQKNNEDKALAIIQELMPEANMIINQDSAKAGTIVKDIKK